MNAPDLHELSIAQAALLIAARHLSPVEYVDALIARTELLDPLLNAYLTRTPELAREQARRAEREISAGAYRGPLHGIPYALKDVIAVAGLPTTGNSRLRAHDISTADATITRRLSTAGALLMGKLALHEFAHGGPSLDLPWPPARNPWNLERVPGGSSSGSGTALAAGLIPASVGTDTGGSIRIPASACGVTGLMPTAGLIARTGVIPHSFTLDRCGPMAATAEDCALLLQALAGHDPRDPASVRRTAPDYLAALDGSLLGLRVGVLRHTWETELPVSSDLSNALEEALHTLHALGATLEDCRMPPLRAFNDVKVILAESEVINVHLPDLRRRAGEFGADMRTRMLPALLFSAQDYVTAMRTQKKLVMEMLALHQRYDVLLMASQGEATPFSAHTSLNFWLRANVFTPANITGQPALALPIGFGATGLPLGMQILGRPFEDATVLKVGHAYQQQSNWHQRRARIDAQQAVPPITIPPILTGTATDVDAQTRAQCMQALANADIRLDDFMLQQMFEGAPHALAMKQRQPASHDYSDTPFMTYHPPRPRAARSSPGSASHTKPENA